MTICSYSSQEVTRNGKYITVQSGWRSISAGTRMHGWTTAAIRGKKDNNRKGRPRTGSHEVAGKLRNFIVAHRVGPVEGERLLRKENPRSVPDEKTLIC